MAFINVPKEILKADIKYHGTITKGNSWGYLISDLENKDIKNTEYLNSASFYDYVYSILDTYLFLVGNQNNRNQHIQLNKIDFLAEILKFELELSKKSKTIKTLKIPSKVLNIISKDKWLQCDLTSEESNKIDFIINHYKTHLKGIQDRYIKYMSYLCDNAEDLTGLFEYGLSKMLLLDDYVKIMKVKNINGYIIKTDFTKF